MLTFLKILGYIALFCITVVGTYFVIMHAIHLEVQGMVQVSVDNYLSTHDIEEQGLSFNK